MSARIKIAELERFLAESHGYPEDFALDYEEQGVPAGLAALLRLARAAHAYHVKGGRLDAFLDQRAEIDDALAAFDFGGEP